MPSMRKTSLDRAPSDTERAGRSPRAAAAMSSVPKLDWALKKVRGADRRLKTWMWLHRDALLAEYGLGRLDLEELLATALFLGLTNDRGKAPNKDVISKTMFRVRKRARAAQDRAAQAREVRLPPGVTVQETPVSPEQARSAPRVDGRPADRPRADPARSTAAPAEGGATPPSSGSAPKLTAAEKIALSVRKAQAGHQQMPRHD